MRASEATPPNEAGPPDFGVFSRRALNSNFISDRQIQAAVRSGELLWLNRLYALPSAPPDLVAAARLGCGLTCESGARLHGLWVLGHRDRSRIHVAATRSSTLPSRFVRHRVIGTSRGIVQSVRACVAQCVLCLPTLEAVCVLDSALNKGLVSLDEIAALVAHEPGVERARHAIALADARAESGLETLQRLSLLDAGFTVVPQFSVPGVGRVDALVDSCVVSEMDGRRFHNTAEGFREDRRRLNALSRLGFTLVRHEFEDVWPDPSNFVADLRHAVTASQRGLSIRARQLSLNSPESAQHRSETRK